MTNNSRKGFHKTKKIGSKTLILNFIITAYIAHYMETTTLSFKEPHDYIWYIFDTMKSSLINTTSVIKNSSSQKPKTIVAAFSTTT